MSKSKGKNKNIILDEVELKRKIYSKIHIFQEIMINTIHSINNTKKYELFSISEINVCTEKINELFIKTNKIIENKYDSQLAIEELQVIINNLSILLSNYGTQYLDELLYVIFGSEYNNFNFENDILDDKYKLLKKYFHPIGFKTIKWKENHKIKKPTENEICSDKITDFDTNYETENMLECFDIDITTKNFYKKVYGIQVVFQNETAQKTLVVRGLVDDIFLDLLSNRYIILRKKQIQDDFNNIQFTDQNICSRLIEISSLKDVLIYGNKDFQKKYCNIIKRVNDFNNNSIEKNIKMFLEMDIHSQRILLISLMVYIKNTETQYCTYLLYDLLNSGNLSSINVDSSDQQKIYNSFTWKLQLFFKDAMKHTIKYTQDMINKYDSNKISYEQQIYLMKVPENVKEKALLKLKEIKGRNDDMSIKSKQYLEGLLKIPFNIFCEEPILKIQKKNNNKFSVLINLIRTNYKSLFNENTELLTKMEIKPQYTNYEIISHTKTILNELQNRLNENILSSFDFLNIKDMLKIIRNMKADIDYDDSNNKKQRLFNHIKENILQISDNEKIEILQNINNNKFKMNNVTQVKPIYYDCQDIIKSCNYTDDSINKIKKILDESIYGHEYAKNQILKIIGQWINGEQSGYCFGFEGSPGIGKTSLAKKGLANCLIDENDVSRSFSFIALGGSSNGSTLEGHSYTYVNSTWGRIVDILMETKCMNPIIYIDELDKVSKTEHGKEIIGILTHLIDYTQNMAFQDKYFSGIDLDLSKALFIFSYNDPEQIDRILLDRIHRIKFDNLSLQDKIVIVNKYILPNINEKMGFNNVVHLSNEVIEYIIEFYTLEPGVRKLKEIIFDLFGEINIELLNANNENEYEFPIKITIDDLEQKYLYKYKKINEKKIHKIPKIGIINGLWANALGKGGIITIESIFFPSSVFLDFKLTGLQGDVMKESMNVAKNLAWSLTPSAVKKGLLKTFKETLCQGIHVHCPEGSISKDGPSAGVAITIAIYSLLNNIPILNDVAITGEIDLQGNITAIGGLENKILGGIRSGIKTFLYPKENLNDLNHFIKKNEDDSTIQNIKFIEISHITEVFKHIFK